MILFAFNMNGQDDKYEKKWDKVDKFQDKALPKSALEEVDDIYKTAKKDENYDQIIKAYIHRMKFRQSIEEDAFENYIYELESDIKQTQTPTKSVMHSMLAEMYWMYYQANRYRFFNRSTTVNFDLKDIKTWDLKHLVDQVIKHFMLSVKDKDILQQTPIKNYEDVIDFGTNNTVGLRPTLFDFLAFRAIDFFKHAEISVDRPADKFVLTQDYYFGKAKDFVNQKIETKDTLSLHFYGIKLLQQVLDLRLSKDNRPALLDADIQRLKFVYQYSANPLKDSLYLERLQQLEQKYSDLSISAEVSYKIASFYSQQAKKYNPLQELTDPYRFKFKNALEKCEQTYEKYPESRGGIKCENLKRNILQPSLSIYCSKKIMPGESFPVKMTFKNTENVYLRLSRIKRKELEEIIDKKYGKERFDKFFNKSEKITEETIELPKTGDYQQHSTEFLLEGLPVGYYIVMASTDPKFSYKKEIVSYNHFVVTNFNYIERRNQNGNIELYVLDKKSGEPIPDVSITPWYTTYDYKKSEYKRINLKKQTTNKRGYTLVPAPDNLNPCFFDFEKENDFLTTDRSFYFSRPPSPPQTHCRTTFFTDRAIYRPGQTIYFKAIALCSKGEKHEILPKETINVKLKDVNSQEVASQTFTTNEYGTISGSFQLPTGVLTGSMYLQSPNGSHSFKVEEYKRPKFEVQLSTFSGNYRLNDTVTVKGKAKAYAGSTISDAQVKYRVVREPQWRGWWWFPMPSSTTEITNGTITTDESGNFEFDFKAVPDISIPKSQHLVFNYSITIDVTDINGETQSTSGSLVVGYKNLELNIAMPDEVFKHDKKEFSISARNINGVPLNAEGELNIYKLQDQKTVLRERLWERPDQFLYSKQEWQEKYPGNEYKDDNNIKNRPVKEKLKTLQFNTAESKKLVLDEIENWETGQYMIEMLSVDTFGQEVKQKVFFTLLSQDEDKPPYPLAFFTKAVKSTGEPGEKATFLIGSSYGNVHLLYEIEHKGKIVQTEHLTLNNEMRKIEIPIEEKHRGNFSVHFVFIKNNRAYKYSQIITVPYTNKRLDIEFATFRDKLYPGQQEEWKILIKGKNGDKLAAEMLATLYDASLDAFVYHSWNFSLYQRYYTSRNWSAYTTSSLSGINLAYGFYNALSVPSKTYDSFNWFGFSYYNYYQHRRYRKTSRAAPSAMVKEEALEEVEDGRTGAVAEVQEDSVSLPTEKQMAKNGESQKQEKPQESGEEIVPRTNFNETAFFYPHLSTNQKGEVIVKFTVPESLTRWKMLGFAHTKDLKFGFVQNSLVTQKDLMVMPNPPRFFREGDEITFPVKISNISEKDLSGNIDIEFFDAITLKPIEGILKRRHKSEKEFTVKAGQNTMVSWDLEIPKKTGVISYKVIARAGDFSDGEQKPLPVLTNRMMVTESLPLPVRGNETKTFELKKLTSSRKSKTLRHHKLTLEFTSNPAWYAVQALPYIMEYPYECSEQTFSRFYANSLAHHIVNSSPKVKAVFDAWSEDEDSKALLSNLEKNQELKSVLLQETPWVLDAKNETQRKKRVAVLFDLNRMSNELTKAILKLQQAQTTNGGWPWFKGMPESWYITQHIVAGMGHLTKLGVDVSSYRGVEDMNQNAIRFIDNKIRDYYLKLKKNYSNKKMKNDHLSYTAIHYLYARSFFTDIPVPRRSKEAFDYFISQSEKYWLDRNKYAQGMIALALHRFGNKQVPQDIVRSLREYAMHSDEMGMYWKEVEAGYYWYQAPIETQALLIEVFAEVANDEKAVEECKIWLLKQKQTQDWKTTKATVEAVYALLLQGGDWLANDQIAEITVGDQKVDPENMPDLKVEAGTGYFKTAWHGKEIKPQMGEVTVHKPGKGIAWGAIYWQYFEQLDKISHHETPLKIKKELFIERHTESGNVIEPISQSDIKVGDKIIVRVEIRVDRHMEYVHLKDMRASGFEPVNVLSRYKYQDGLGYYESTKDASTNFFIDYLSKGTYVFEYPLRVAHKGDFSNGITTIQCMYAPEFTSHSKGIRVKVEE